MSADKWVWRSPSDEYYGSDEYDYKGDAIIGAIESLKHWSESSRPDHFFVGKTVSFSNEELIDIDCLIEQAYCTLDDMVSNELTEDYLVMKDSEKEELKAIICRWLDQKGFTPTGFFGIKNEERVSLK